MSASKKLRVDTTERACHECRKRKTRCIIPAGGVTCSYCFRKGKDCVFNDRPERTPLTRKNLDAAEARCRELESMLEQRSEFASSTPNMNNDNLMPATSDDVMNYSRGQNQNEHLREMNVPTGRSGEWQEQSTLDDTAEQDGMAALVLPSKDSGYLGSSSGSNLLQSLSVYLSPGKATSSPHTYDQNERNSEHARDSLSSFRLASSSRISIATARDHFIDAYFVAYNSSYPIIHERIFREECLRKAQKPSNDIWHILYYTVLAIGEWVSGHSAEHHSLYYEAARSRLGFDVLESGNMGLVQALLLLGNYLQKKDRPNTAYNFIGIAYRVALGLGLHRELPAGNGMNGFALQQRRVLFWTLYSFDSGFSMTTGRPTLVSDMFIDTRKPTNINDSVPTGVLLEVNYPTTYSAIIAQARLAVIANKVYSNFLSVRACSDVEDLVATMEQTIRNWRSSLPKFFFDDNVPQWFLGPRKILFWKEANLQIALLLASQRNHIDDQDKILISTKCQAVSVSTILDISQFCLEHSELIHVGLCWYAVYFLLHALLALGLHQLKARQIRWAQTYGQENSQQDMESAVQKARECLQMLGRSHKAALRTIQILDRIQETLNRPPNGDDSNATHVGESHLHNAQQNHDSITANSSRPSVPIAHVDQSANTTGGIGNVTKQAGQVVFPESSPEEAYTDCIMNEWVGMTDPSLHFFFDKATSELDDVFQGMQGFPNVVEGDNFGYMTSTMHSVRIPEHNQHDWGTYEN